MAAISNRSGTVFSTNQSDVLCAQNTPSMDAVHQQIVDTLQSQLAQQQQQLEYGWGIYEQQTHQLAEACAQRDDAVRAVDEARAHAHVFATDAELWRTNVGDVQRQLKMIEQAHTQTVLARACLANARHSCRVTNWHLLTRSCARCALNKMICLYCLPIKIVNCVHIDDV
jgi:hypothetical protein